jgi:predicted lactoylglutathione lyase
MAFRFILNLPVRSLPAALAFWDALGYAAHPQFRSDTAAAVMLDTDIAMMLHEDASFLHNTDRRIADPATTTEAIVSFACPTRAAVDATIIAALQHGAREFGHGADHGFIYHRSFVDPDGHQFEPFWMAPNNE